jgi:hypothetical protein
MEGGRNISAESNKALHIGLGADKSALGGEARE